MDQAPHASVHEWNILSSGCILSAYIWLLVTPCDEHSSFLWHQKYSFIVCFFYQSGHKWKYARQGTLTSWWFSQNRAVKHKNSGLLSEFKDAERLPCTHVKWFWSEEQFLKAFKRKDEVILLNKPLQHTQSNPRKSSSWQMGNYFINRVPIIKLPKIASVIRISNYRSLMWDIAFNSIWNFIFQNQKPHWEKLLTDSYRCYNATEIGCDMIYLSFEFLRSRII